MLLAVNHCKNHNVVIKFDFSRGCQNNILETKKNMRVLHCFFKQFLSVHNCASVYSLALYRQVFLVIMLSPSQLWYSIQDARRGETCANFTIATMNNEVLNCQNLRTTGILLSASCRLWYKCSHVKKLQWGYISLN